MSPCALPNELLEAILLQLPAQSDSKESVRTLCKFGEASTRFLAVSRSPPIWHSHYAAQWNRCHPGHEALRKANTCGDWRKMYAARSQTDSIALNLLDSIVNRREQREYLATELASLGCDVWQAISRQTTKVCYLTIPDKSTPNSFHVPSRGLTVQYWAREALGVISRVRAIDTWKGLTNPLEDVSFEQGLAALSAFFGADIDNIFEELDRLAEGCRGYLASKGLADSTNQTEMVVAICAWMQQEGFVKVDLVNFHNLLNHFPHSVLFGQPRTLPISLVYVFVCVARRLGINACPVAFPHRVLAVVSPPVRESGEDIYVDVFESATHPILSFSEDLPAMLIQMGLDPITLPRQSAPASTATMVLRAASNIIHSLDRQLAWTERDHSAAHYAAYCAALLITGDPRLVPALFVDGIGGPLDHAVVFKETLERNLPERAQQVLDLHLNSANLGDLEGSAPRRAPRDDIMYFTGMVFRHRKFGYLGLVNGWDYRCEAGDEWIRAMRVEELPRGPNQPFYQTFTADGLTRYVAEENIEPIPRPVPNVINLFLECNRTMGRWFDGFDLDTGRFILSPESRLLYPMDDVFGSTFFAVQTSS